MKLFQIRDVKNNKSSFKLKFSVPIKRQKSPSNTNDGNQYLGRVEGF